MINRYMVEKESDYKWSWVCKLASWLMFSMCPDFGYDADKTGGKLEDTIMQFGLFMDLGQCMVNAGCRQTKEELAFLCRRYTGSSVRFTNGKSLNPEIPPVDHIWTQYCHRRYAMGNHHSGNAIMGAWLAMAGNLRLQQFIDGRFKQPAATEAYLISALLNFELTNRECKRQGFYEDPLMFFITLAKLFTDYQENNTSLSIFRDYEERSVVYIKDRFCKNIGRMEAELREYFYGMHLHFRAQENGTVMMLLSPRFWEK